MKYRILRVVHLIAVCLFVGSIPAHIILGAMAKAVQGSDAFAAYHQAKFALTTGLTTTAIAFTAITGILLVISRRGVLKDRWLRAKLLLIVGIAINAAVVLTPLAEQMKDMAIAANGAALPAEFHALESKESIAGALNMLLIITVIFLAGLKPRLGKKRGG